MVGVGIIQNWCRNSKFHLRSHRIAFSHVMPNTRSQLLYANASGQPFFQIWLPSLLQGILGPFHYPAPDRPFYRRATSSAKHPNFLRLSLKTDKLASLGPFFVERSAIPCEGIVVNFLFWQECSKGLLCCLCRELGWASEWVCPDVPLVAISRTDFFVTEEWLQMAHTLDVRIIMVTAGPALQKHDGYQYMLECESCSIARPHLPPMWSEARCFLWLREQETLRHLPHLPPIWIDSWQIDIWSHRIVSYALPDFQSLSLRGLAQPPTFFCQFPLYRRTFIL